MSTEEPADGDVPAAAGRTPTDGPETRRLPARRWKLLAAVALLGLVADIVTKSVVVATLQPWEPVELLGGMVYFQLLRNPAAAFGLGEGMTPLLTVFAMLVAVGIGWFARKIRTPGWAIGFGLVLAGALGNLVDRLFRPPGPFHGHVVDFVSVFAPNGEVWPVFNIADSCICVGAVLIVVLSLFGRDHEGNPKTLAQRDRGTDSGEDERD